MAELRALCEGLGFEAVTTHIWTGDVVFRSSLTRPAARRALEDALQRKMGRPVTVQVRSPAELEALLAAIPFPDADPKQVVVFFLDRPPGARALAAVEIPGREAVEARGKHVFVHYPDGQARSKLKLPFAQAATGRNLSTVRRLASLAARA